MTHLVQEKMGRGREIPQENSEDDSAETNIEAKIYLKV